MSEATPPTEDAQVPPADSGGRRRFLQRWARRVFVFVVALLAALFVSFFSIDLGRFPQLKALAEEQGTNYLERPLHIGRISALITPGAFTLHDVVIEGRQPGDRPFMRIGRIRVNVPWWTIFRRELHVNVRLDDWAMVIETWPDGTHNMPKIMPRRRAPSGPKRFTTTVDYAYAHSGHFTYEDHGTPWSVVAPNLTFDFARSTAMNEYVGRAGFTGGTVQIQSYLPMAADLETRFQLDGSIVRLRHIDLVADGSTSHVSGEIDMGNWPNQYYNVSSTIDFARMKELFFTKETWRLGGEGQFTGVFQLGKQSFRDLTGDFTSELATVNDLQFPDLHGSLTWTPKLFAVTHAEAGLLHGHTRFSYSIAPLGTPTGATATFTADYTDVDLFELDRLMSLRGLRLAGTASGSVELQWPNGRMSTGRRGSGHTVITPIAGARQAPRELGDVPLPPAPEAQPFDPTPRSTPLAVGADLHYAFEPGLTTFGDSWVTTTHSYIAFSGRMASDGSSEFPFHVTSHDWQESDRLLAGIMTAVSGPTRAIDIGGRGTFDGVMTGAFSAPRIEGAFAGESMRVWDVTWGRATADLVIERGYVDIRNSRIGDGPDNLIVADGRFALGFRDDDADEIDARVTLANWPIADLRHAFQLDDWPMDGTIAASQLELRGKYRAMFGTGRLEIANGQAWGERFDTATADLALEGSGMRLGRIDIHKGPGRMVGAARIGWDGTYAFNVEGESVPVESLDTFRVEQAPLTGRLTFKASGASEFDSPSYEFDASIDDLFVGNEGIGSVSGRVVIANDVMTVERLNAASSRLQVLGNGTIALDDQYTSDLRFRFQETALDPYLKFVLTDDVSPYTRIVLGGSLAVKGPLATPLDLTVDTTIEDAALTLYDYELRNDRPLRMSFTDGRLAIDSLAFVGSDTKLELAGGADLRARRFDLTAAGAASLAILQLFYSDITSSGAASLNANLSGSFDAPLLTGDAVIMDGRLRPFTSPHSLESLNGRIRFGANAITLDGMTGRVGSGDVDFGGTIGLDGYSIAEFNLTAQGRSMRLRYPAGFNSTVDMNLVLAGPPDQLRLTGTIDVLRMALVATSQSGSGLLGFAAGGTVGASPLAPQAPAAEGPSIALDIQVNAPRMPFVDNDDARVEATADVQVRGTFDAPVIDGTVGIVGGEVVFNGNRYFVREGSIDFSPDSPAPVFNLAAETRPRVSGQTFTVNVGLSGTTDAIDFQLSSDPWLPESDIVSLLFGGTVALDTVEARSLGSSQEVQQQMLQTAGAVLLASPITSRVGRAVERTGAFDTVQITPILQNESFTQLNPTARVTFGKRVSPRVFLTYSRTLGGIEEEIILLEYDQSDRVSWVLSRNEDRTFALDFRLRYVF